MFRKLFFLGIIVSLIGLGILINLDTEAKAALTGTTLPEPTTSSFGRDGQGGGGFGGGGRGGQGGGGGGFGGPPAAAASSADQSPNIRMSGYGLVVSGLILVFFANIITPRLPEPGEEEEVAPPA
ncbi:MAG: hypothetical protein O6762_01790 [Thaumarchaeota archaeon]|nr:hypothetical protein [Nitrososphaerota archaeon]